MALIRSAVSICFGISILIAACPVIAAPPSDTARPVAELPEPGRGTVQGVLINRSNAQQFKEAFVPEMYGLVRSGALTVDAAKRSQEMIRFDESWFADTPAIGETGLDKTGALLGAENFKRGFLFGDRNAILDEHDAEMRGLKILWNTHSLWWSQAYLRADFSLKSLSQNGLEREFRGTFNRVYPRRVVATDKTEQVFREFFALTYPVEVAPYVWLGFRFRGHDEDAVWVYSPAIKKVRQLAGSNRTDGIATTGISMDDLFVWSGKPDSVQVQSADTIMGIMPFLSGTGKAKLASKDCVSLEYVPVQGSGGRWNFQTHRYVDTGGWVPTDALYSPRELFRVELTSRDPYSLYGRQVLYVDAVTMIPIFKLVFDRTGTFWKSVIGLYGIASSNDGRAYPMPAGLAVNDTKAQQSYLLDFADMKYCNAFPEGASLSDFDPSKFLPHVETPKKNDGGDAPQKVEEPPTETPDD